LGKGWDRGRIRSRSGEKRRSWERVGVEKEYELGRSMSWEGV